MTRQMPPNIIRSRLHYRSQPSARASQELMVAEDRPWFEFAAVDGEIMCVLEHIGLPPDVLSHPKVAASAVMPLKDHGPHAHPPTCNGDQKPSLGPPQCVI
jgi:hypothetical protein